MAVKIITDSTSYILESIREEYDIEIVSLSVAFEEEIFKEVEISNETFYEKLEKKDKIPTSSQPSIEEIYRAFEKHIKAKDEVVGVFISSEMSGTYATANMVKDMILEKYQDAKIRIIDARSNCMQLGYAALIGARAAKEGKSIEEVVQAVEENIKRSRFLFIPDTLKYLKKGGRIGTAKALLGTILQIKPILTVKDGKTDVFSKVRTKKKAIQTMVDICLKDIKEHGLGEIAIHHINCEEEGKKLAKKLEEKVGKTVEITSIGPVIGTHVGPGAIGIVYYTKEEMAPMFVPKTNKNIL